MKRKYLVWCAVLLFAVSISVALADTGPKPAVSVYVKNLGGATCYATLLSEREQYGPYCTTEIEKRWDEMRAETAVWEAFAAYKDPDGFFFLQLFKFIQIMHQSLAPGFGKSFLLAKGIAV